MRSASAWGSTKRWGGAWNSAMRASTCSPARDSPSTAGGEWRARFTGEPARTDRPARGFGSIVSEGRWRPGASEGGNLELDCRLEKSAMNEIINLVRGGDLGIHGTVSARAHLAGT